MIHELNKYLMSKKIAISFSSKDDSFILSKQSFATKKMFQMSIHSSNNDRSSIVMAVKTVTVKDTSSVQ